MKIIFLDIDGVLIRFGKTKQIRKTRAEKRQGGMIYDFDEDLVLNLKHLLKETGAYIVISSSWRHDMDRVKQSFLEAGLNYDGLVVDKTPHSLGHGRGNEILSWIMDWIEKYPIFYDAELQGDLTNWIAIDDDNADMKVINRLGRFIHTKTSEGLTIEKMKESINLLNK